MNGKRVILATVAVLAALSPGASFATPSASSCLEIDDARNLPITVEIDGYGGYWVLQPNQTYTIVSTPVGSAQRSRRHHSQCDLQFPRL
jgi:hypothetical protein